MAMIKPGSDSRPYVPLSRRVVGWALLYSALFTLAMTAALVGLHYLEERDNALDQLRFAAAGYHKSLASSLWDLDMPAVRLQLEALSSFPMVGHVMLKTRIGQTIHAGKAEEKIDTTEPLLSWHETLASPNRPGDVVGELQLAVDRETFLQRIESDALRILVAEALKGLLLGVLMAWLVARLVTRHVADMARQVASLDATSLGHGLVLRRRQRAWRDELDALRDAFNSLGGQLLEYIETRRLLEVELREHRDRLAVMVTERTASLERLRSFHSLVIRVLTRFINLPPEQADAAVDQGLAAFADYFGAGRCLLLAHDVHAGAFRVSNAWPPLDSTEPVLRIDENLLPTRMLNDRRARVWLSVTAHEVHETPEQAQRNTLLSLLRSDACTVVGVNLKGGQPGLVCLTGHAISKDSENASLLELAARVAASMMDYKSSQLKLMEMQQALQHANNELHALSRHDPLTGLANRRQFDDIKEIEFRRAIRSCLPLSVLMCDIDEFKRYNDTYGHAQGDRCLKMLSACLKPIFDRAGELLVRLGGEEFAILLPNTGGEQALALAEAMREAIWQMNLPHASSSVADRVTISVGVAALRHGAHRDFDALLQDADLALYRAKNRRNQAVLATG